jgi:hypothetical protein
MALGAASVETIFLAACAAIITLKAGTGNVE